MATAALLALSAAACVSHAPSPSPTDSPPPQPEYGNTGFDPQAYEAAQRAAQERAEAEERARASETARARAEYEAAMAAERAAAERRAQQAADPRWPTLEQVAQSSGPPRFHSWSLCMDSPLRVGSASTLTFAASTQASATSDCPGGGSAGVFEPPAADLAVTLAPLGADSGLAVTTVPITNGGTRFRWTLEPSLARRLNLRVQYAYVADGAEVADFATVGDVEVLSADAPSAAATTTAMKIEAPEDGKGPAGLWGVMTAIGAAMGGLVTVLSNIEKLATMTRKHGGWLVNFVRRRGPAISPAAD